KLWTRLVICLGLPLWGILCLVLPSVPAYGLSCQHVRQLTKVILHSHFSVKQFDEQVARRTLENFLKAWDPGKIYFTAADEAKIMSDSAAELAAKVQKGDCSTIDHLFATYDRRFNERKQLVDKLIGRKFDFSKDEYIDFDRKKLKFASSMDEIEDRVRKRIKFKVMQYKDTVSDPAKIVDKLKKHYSLVRKSHHGLGTDDVYGSYLDAFARALDPHSDYVSPTSLEEFQIQSSLSFQGIGAVLRSEDGVTTVQQLIQGGAAQKSGLLKVEDKIVAVAQGEGPPVDVVDMELKDVVKLIRGPRDTMVKLTLRRDGKEILAPIKREEIKLEENAAKSNLFEVQLSPQEKHSIGYIELPSFYMDFEGRQAKKDGFRSSSRDMIAEIEKLSQHQIKGLVLDLRSNGGGSLAESINVAGLFSGKVPVVQSKGKSGPAYVHRYDHEAVYQGPLVVMIDRQSASASEILAGAIQDYERGILVGDEHTFGKGTVQNLEDVNRSLGALKITISKFYRPSGASTQLRGVVSDITLPSILSEYEVGEKFYPYALEWGKVAKVNYPKFGAVKPYLERLKTRSVARVAEDKDFIEVQKLIQEFKDKKSERTRVSLKEEPKKKDEDKKAKEEKTREDKKEDDLLANDPTLKEALRIASDYVRLLEHKDKDAKLGSHVPQVVVVKDYAPQKKK
ncbi:MAG: carboxy terminal-processing peptidase, partial [Zetaproteobacteria bacterium]|nr:carboxy terminal-processing peptidase [Zetaproteobacteria bacterium]